MSDANKDITINRFRLNLSYFKAYFPLSMDYRLNEKGTRWYTSELAPDKNVPTRVTFDGEKINIAYLWAWEAFRSLASKRFADGLSNIVTQTHTTGTDKEQRDECHTYDQKYTFFKYHCLSCTPPGSSYCEWYNGLCCSQGCEEYCEVPAGQGTCAPWITGSCEWDTQGRIYRRRLQVREGCTIDYEFNKFVNTYQVYLDTAGGDVMKNADIIQSIATSLGEPQYDFLGDKWKYTIWSSPTYPYLSLGSSTLSHYRESGYSFKNLRIDNIYKCYGCGQEETVSRDDGPGEWTYPEGSEGPYSYNDNHDDTYHVDRYVKAITTSHPLPSDLLVKDNSNIASINEYYDKINTWVYEEK